MWCGAFGGSSFGRLGKARPVRDGETRWGRVRQARLVLVRPGVVWRGKAERGWVRQASQVRSRRGLVVPDMVRQAGYGKVRHGGASSVVGPVWQARLGSSGFGGVRLVAVWLWRGSVRYGRQGTVRYG